MKAIAVHIESYNIDYSPSILNLLDFLSDRCRIDLFFRNVQMKNSPVLRKMNIRLHEIRRPFHWRRMIRSARRRLAAGIKGRWRNAFLPSRSVRAISRRFADRDYHCHIVFDPSGMALCKELFPLAKPFFYSLELALLSEAASGPEAQSIRAYLEKARGWNRDIRGLIVQSPERERLLRSDTQLPESIPALHLPVTGRGPAVAERRDLLQKKYAVPPGARIAIHLGGANPYYSSLELAEVFMKIRGWYLFFQGNHLRGYGEKIRALAKRMGAQNIIVLNTFYTEIGSLDRILMSCDAGIAWYNDLNANFRSAGQSSGKITAYLKFGLPVIANRYPSTEEALVKTGCGICVSAMDEIPSALEKIAENYEAFSANARREYERQYRFENYRQSISRFLEPS
jgi:glycosyltransferase involved in cell wall biosynthesis